MKNTFAPWQPFQVIPIRRVIPEHLKVIHIIACNEVDHRISKIMAKVNKECKNGQNHNKN